MRAESVWLVNKSFESSFSINLLIWFTKPAFVICKISDQSGHSRVSKFDNQIKLMNKSFSESLPWKFRFDTQNWPEWFTHESDRFRFSDLVTTVNNQINWISQICEQFILLSQSIQLICWFSSNNPNDLWCSQIRPI